MSRQRALDASLLVPLALLILLFPFTAHADGGQVALDSLAPSGTSLLIRALGSLGGVVALIALLALLLRRLRESNRGARGAASMRTTGRLDLGGRREIRLVEVGRRTLVLGVTEKRVDLLTELDEAPAEVSEVAEVPDVVEAESSTDRRRPAFKILRKLATSG